MDILRYWLQIGAHAVLLVGPPFILALWTFRTSRLPGVFKYTLCSVGACTAVYWLLFLTADYILDLQFQELIPDNEWTPSDELAWTESERRVVSAYFADGGRNVLALFAPVILLANSLLFWILARVFAGFIRRRAA